MKKLSGFTLLELMSTIAIGGILVALAVPGMREFVQKAKMTSFTNEMVSTIHISRSEAIKRAGITCICSTTDATVVAPVCDGGDAWETGWFAFFDSTGNCVYDAAVDELLRVVDNNGLEDFTVRNNNLSINIPDFIRFNGRGVPQLANGSVQQGLFTLCDIRGHALDGAGDTIPRGVMLSASGSVRSTKNAAIVVAANCP